LPRKSLTDCPVWHPEVREGYATLLEAAFMVQRLPVWGTTLGRRMSGLWS
jgi:hypothetical protein